MKIIKNYEKACNELVKRFEDEASLEFDGWIGDRIGDIASFSCIYFFSMTDIKFAIENDINPGWVLHWHDYNTERGKFSIDLSSYCRLRKGQNVTDKHFTKLLNDFLRGS